MKDVVWAKVIYTNWRGETRTRIIRPGHIFFGSNCWHRKPQWLLRVFDYEKRDERDFAVNDISAWEPWEPEEGEVRE